MIRVAEEVSDSLRRRVLDLYAEYAELLDDGPLEGWPALFTMECSYRLAPRENYDLGLPLAAMRCDSRGMLEDRVRAVTSLSVYAPRYLRHFITNLRIRVVQEYLSVRANYLVYQTDVDGATSIHSTGRYIDRLVDSDGSLLFAEKLCVYDSILVNNAVIYPV